MLFLVANINWTLQIETRTTDAQSHSWLGHYFYSNHYGCAPRGAKGVKITRRAQGSILKSVFVLTFSPNWKQLWNMYLIKSTKFIKKRLFSDSFSKLTQFGQNIIAKPQLGIVHWSFKFFSHRTPCIPGGASIRPSIHSEDIMVFVFAFDISEWWRPL